MSKQREKGWYYVKNSFSLQWDLAFYNQYDKVWFMAGTEVEFLDEDFYEIGEKIEMPK